MLGCPLGIQQVECYISLLEQTIWWLSYIGLPFTNATIITLSAMFMIVYSTEILYLFINITNYLELQPDLILYLFV